MPKTPPKRLAYILQWQRDNPAKVLAREQRKAKRREAKGLCNDCTNPLSPGHTLCDYHRRKRRDEQMKKVHGLSLQEYEQRVAEQDGKCAICLQPSKLHVDHCHTYNYLRGLLCNNCNNGLGRFKDNPEWLERAARYIRFDHDIPAGKIEWIRFVENPDKPVEV